MKRESRQFECKSLLVPLAVAALVLLNVVLIRQAVVPDAPAAPVVAAPPPLAHHPLPPPVHQAPPPPPPPPPVLPPPPPPPVIVQAAPQIDIAALKRQTHHYDEFDEYDPANNPLHAFVANYHRGPVIDKWTWYFPIYHRYMRKFLDRRSINMMEIGVSGGGSLYMWKQYFEKIDHPSALLAKEDRQVRIVGLDIAPGAKAWERPDQNVFVRIGDQANAAFLESVAQEFGPFDILVEDGGHSMRQMTVTFETMWKHIKPGGVYIAEDLHTCYWKDWEGSPPPHPETNFCRKALEMFHDLNSAHFKAFDPKEIRSFHAFDSVIVFEKAYPGELKPFNHLTRLTRGDGTRLP